MSLPIECRAREDDIFPQLEDNSWSKSHSTFHVVHSKDLTSVTIDVEDNSDNISPCRHGHVKASKRATLCSQLELALVSDDAVRPVNFGQTGGVYSIRRGTSDDTPSSESCDLLAVFKPGCQESFVRRGVPAGQGAAREEAAYLLDRMFGSKAGVPVTTCVDVFSSSFDGTYGGLDSSRATSRSVGSWIRGSVQQFVPNILGSADDFGMPRQLIDAARIVSVSSAQHLAAFDIRVCNTDRHSGNLLFRCSLPASGTHPLSFESLIPVPIDHGCILPSWWSMGEACFAAWEDWPQIRETCLPEVLESIEASFARTGEVIDMLADIGLNAAAQATYRISVSLLRECTIRHGLSLSTVARLMCRNLASLEVPSWLELQMEQCSMRLGIPWDWCVNDRGDKLPSVPASPIAPPPVGFLELLEATFRSEATRLAGLQLEISS